jgi:tRNA nucleotidyltransferase (CCA-adding enzyme)
MSDPRNLLTSEDKLVLQSLRIEGKAWIVGGWVRDVLLGKSLGDLDIATTLTPDEVKRLFPRTIPVGEDYGTVIVRLDEGNKGEWEVTTLREEGNYGDGRRPDNVVFGQHIELDLARRDFTINAMAIDENGIIIDLFDGKKDLQHDIIRTVGNATERIAEDGLRIMRAFRFLDKDGITVRSLDNDLEKAIIENKGMLQKVSNERIGEEFKKLLASKKSFEILQKMEETGVLQMILKNISIDLNDSSRNNPLVTLARILRRNECNGSELYSKLRDNLKFSKKELRLISFLHDYKNVKFEENIESIRRFMIYLSNEQKLAILEYHQPLEFIEELNKLENTADNISPLVDGITLSRVTGIQPGPKLGMLKGWLFRIQIEKNITHQEEVLESLENIDWNNENYQTWPIISWP